MKKIENLEVIQLTTENGKLVAIISYQDTEKISDINNGYDTTKVPVNIRELQYSYHGNFLVNQSLREDNLILSITNQP